MFDAFKLQWELKEKSQFEPLESDRSRTGCLTKLEKECLVSRKPYVVKELKEYLKDTQPRDDYKEFGRLALLLLGENDATATICIPGTYHCAR